MELSIIQSSIFLMIVILPLIQHQISIEANDYDDCRALFKCGNVDVTYPFYDGEIRPERCGFPGFQLECNSEDQMPEISVTTSISQKYYILRMNSNSQTVSVAPEDYYNGYCPDPENLYNTTLDFNRFNYTPTAENITLYYECPNPSQPQVPNQFSCSNINNDLPVGYFMSRSMQSIANYLPTPPALCQDSIVVPVNQSSANGIRDLNSLQTAFHNGFDLNWIAANNQCHDCRGIGGECGYDTDLNSFACYCPDELHNPMCHIRGKSSTNKAVVIGASVGGIVVAAVLACGSIFLVKRRRQALSEAESKDLGPSNLNTSQHLSNGFQSSQGYTTSPSTYMSQSTPSYPSSKSDFEKSADYLGVPVFSFDELEEATNKFHESQELGDGGFGTVYYGKLYDGRLVAVKRLYENSCRHMGQFLNEIHILARLRHKNLVTLYGCTSRKSRDLLLVYEYISNGTVADHLHGKLAQSNVLPWSTRLNIAVETAEALTFLHENDVIHRDVKTTNILLENSFRVKVADFGLSRLFPNDVTHVSTAPQGTPGYVDPEYYQCYQLTEKSDVYSFGVVLAELISSKMAVDITRHRHDINLANMTVDRIQKHALEELVDPKLGFETDCLAQKMVKLVAEVAFQCLQQEKDARPCMKEVLESLKGIQKEMENAQKQVVVDIHESDDDVGLLKNAPPPLSPETEATIKSIR